MSKSQFKDLILLLATKPRLGMQRILDMNLTKNEIILLAATVSVFAGICGYGSILILPPVEGAVVPSPLGYVFVASMSIAVTSLVFFWAGRTVKGTGDFTSVALAMIVHQAFVNFLPLFVAISSVIFPGLYGFIFALGFVYAVYLMAGFIAQAHNLRSTGTAVILIVAVLFGISAVLVFFISLFGISPV